MAKTTGPARKGFSVLHYVLAACIVGAVYNLVFSTSSSTSLCGSTPTKSQTSNTSSDKVCQSVLDSLEARFDRQVDARRKQAHNLDNFDILEPEAICVTDERFGSVARLGAFYDGPKFVCGVDRLAKQNDCLVYSIGSANQITFERAVKLHMGCEVHTFDPTLRRPFSGGEFATFHPWGIGTEGRATSFNGHAFVSMSIQSIMKELGHTGRKLDILKIDCEGCEFDALTPLFRDIAEGKLEIDQIQVEMHQRKYISNWKYKMIDFMDAMDKADLKVFHKERNGWGCFGSTCVEYAIASRSFLRQANADLVCATEPVTVQAFGGNPMATKRLRANMLQQGIKYHQLEWKDLPKDLQKAAAELAYTEKTWDAEEKDAKESIPWDDLSQSHLQAAAKLGYDESSWEGDQ